MKESFSDFCLEHNINCIAPGGGHKRARPGWVQLDCPFCGRYSNKFHLGFNISAGFFVCWKCGWHPPNKVLAEILGVSFKEGTKLFSGVEVNRSTVEKITGKLKLPKRIKPLQAAHKRYLIGRGFKPGKLARIWGLKGIGVSVNRWAWRVFIPITYKGQVVSYTSRSIVDDEFTLRYLSAAAEDEAINHKELLYGADLTSGACVVVEGPADAWNIGPGAVATCGIGYSPAQLARISAYPVRAICFDNGTKAQERAAELCDVLMTLPGVTYNVQLDADDPGSAPKKEIKKLRKAILK